jgi:hypothetical protein
MKTLRPLTRFVTIALALTTLLAPRTAHAQVSPGPLSSPHVALDGPTECFKCHARGTTEKGMESNCLSCHTEIAWMQTAARGTHAKLGSKTCVNCHPEHGGRSFNLIVWEGGAPEKFDHQRAGFVLEGKHAVAQCRACHKPEYQKSGAAPLIRKKDRTTSWLGLEQACEKCHQEPHRGQLGTQCSRCHTPKAWKPATGFDHSKASFPLTGSHLKVECAKCHLDPRVATTRDAKGLLVPQWKPMPHSDCVSCHKDRHEGRFKDACSKCHTTAGWKVFNKSGFNHDMTKYPLRGKHAAIACGDCHDSKKAFGLKPKFDLCIDCHKDIHGGKATLLGQAADCAHCHTVEGFDKPAYTVLAHAQSKFPLAGRHAATDCQKCHVKLPNTPAIVAVWGSARVMIRPSFTRCTPCHNDPHAGRFEPTGPRPHKGGCLDCHSMDGFRPSRYDSRLHLECVFPLKGAHQAVPCQNCHAELKIAPSPSSLPGDVGRARVLRFENTKRQCADCHESQHGKQFASRKDKGACQGCHEDRAFSPASKFDHNKDARFKLEGVHGKTPCAACHVPQFDSAGKKIVVYRPTPTNCEACHAGGFKDSSGIDIELPKKKRK